MSYADHIFIEMCKDILENGTSTEGEKVRPHWADGESAYTVKKFGVVNRYDLSEEFPIMTLRRTALKSATDEMLWIWQQKSNNINDLHSHIWDEWADADGSDYMLPVKAGEELTLVRRTSRGYVVKKDGICGWYKGELRNAD